MTVYYIISYDITNPDAFAEYPPKAGALIQQYGGTVLASDTAAQAIEGKPRMMNAIVSFPSEEAALACYNDPEYQRVKALRINNTANGTMVLAKAFAPE